MSENNPGYTRNSAEHEVVMERVFNAPRELVFQAFSDPEKIAKWWGPKDWTTPVSQMDFRPGGSWLYMMQGPNGEEAWGKSFYQEIVPPERIVYADFFVDPQGNPVAGMPELHVTITFEEVDGKTKLTNRAKFASETDLDSVINMGMVEGLNQSWDRLDEVLKA